MSCDTRCVCIELKAFKLQSRFFLLQQKIIMVEDQGKRFLAFDFIELISKNEECALPPLVRFAAPPPFHSFKGDLFNSIVAINTNSYGSKRLYQQTFAWKRLEDKSDFQNGCLCFCLNWMKIGIEWDPLDARARLETSHEDTL